MGWYVEISFWSDHDIPDTSPDLNYEALMEKILKPGLTRLTGGFDAGAFRKDIRNLVATIQKSYPGIQTQFPTDKQLATNKYLIILTSLFFLVITLLVVHYR